MTEGVVPQMDYVKFSNMPIKVILFVEFVLTFIMFMNTVNRRELDSHKSFVPLIMSECKDK